jgi:hypothetical protein
MVMAGITGYDGSGGRIGGCGSGSGDGKDTNPHFGHRSTEGDKTLADYYVVIVGIAGYG